LTEPRRGQVKVGIHLIDDLNGVAWSYLHGAIVNNQIIKLNIGIAGGYISAHFQK